MYEWPNSERNNNREDANTEAYSIFHHLKRSERETVSRRGLLFNRHELHPMDI